MISQLCLNYSGLLKNEEVRRGFPWFAVQIRQLLVCDRLRVSSGRGAARAEDAQGTPTQSHISPSILVYEEKPCKIFLFPLRSEAVQREARMGRLRVQQARPWRMVR